MSKSTKLSSAVYALCFVAAHDPETVTTDRIAEAVKDHPTRVRQLISSLAKAGIVKSVRGASGGVLLARPSNEIALSDIYTAVEDQPMLAFSLKEPNSDWKDICRAHASLTEVYLGIENDSLTRLSKVFLNQLYKPS